MISGFTFVKNATRLYYPVKASITSILPIVDEFIVALGESDEGDFTRREIESIGSDKIKIINTSWDYDNYPQNTIYARQTDIAKEACSGDWLFYIQSDEVIHEKYLPYIKSACEKYTERKEIEGFLFKFRHFWGDYEHYHQAHNWYPFEIRIIRNDPKIHSWKDAQSFRRFNTFDYSYEDYLKKEGSNKLNVIRLDAFMNHYGFVRPPKLMTTKTRSNASSFWGKEKTTKEFKSLPTQFDYGPLNNLATFKGSHPKVLESWISDFHWKDQLQYHGKRNKSRLIHKHEKVKYRILSFLEYRLLNGRQIGGFKNYKIAGHEPLNT